MCSNKAVLPTIQKIILNLYLISYVYLGQCYYVQPKVLCLRPLKYKVVKGGVEMKRKDYAKLINWRGTATREIKTNYLPDHEVGQIINPGLCWTDGGEFAAENNGKYSVIFEIVEPVDGHAVDYENEDECYDLGCEDCYKEKEILIDKNFVITEAWEYDEEVGFARVFIKEV